MIKHGQELVVLWSLPDPKEKQKYVDGYRSEIGKSIKVTGETFRMEQRFILLFTGNGIRKDPLEQKKGVRVSTGEGCLTTVVGRSSNDVKFSPSHPPSVSPLPEVKRRFSLTQSTSGYRKKKRLTEEGISNHL